MSHHIGFFKPLGFRVMSVEPLNIHLSQFGKSCPGEVLLERNFVPIASLLERLSSASKQENIASPQPLYSEWPREGEPSPCPHLKSQTGWGSPMTQVVLQTTNSLLGDTDISLLDSGTKRAQVFHSVLHFM